MRLILTMLLTAVALQPAPGEIRLIVKGDDMGAAHGINTATINAFKNGVLTTTNVIVPGPWFPEAARLLKENPGLDVDHASTDDAEMRAIGHASYEWVAADRAAVFEAWSSQKVREVITRRGIKLPNYRELSRR
jgi:hypothetical protein